MIEINGDYYGLASIGKIRFSDAAYTITYVFSGGGSIQEVFDNDSDYQTRKAALAALEV